MCTGKINRNRTGRNRFGDGDLALFAQKRTDIWRRVERVVDAGELVES